MRQEGSRRDEDVCPRRCTRASKGMVPHLEVVRSPFAGRGLDVVGGTAAIRLSAVVAVLPRLLVCTNVIIVAGGHRNTLMEHARMPAWLRMRMAQNKVCRVVAGIAVADAFNTPILGEGGGGWGHNTAISVV